MNRLGNLVILLHKYETVWWYEEERFEQHKLGAHGGIVKGRDGNDFVGD
ncbi:MAG: hypothetical protein F6K55_37680 [Moorea sp. SIO4A3]|nr:hypothetical protein [Moorena sp. SIO4A3]